jgi:SPX domain protein involved in polyphosphate accumulation
LKVQLTIDVPPGSELVSGKYYLHIYDGELKFLTGKECAASFTHSTAKELVDSLNASLEETYTFCYSVTA